MLQSNIFHQKKHTRNTRFPWEAAKIIQTPDNKKELAVLWGFSWAGYKSFIDIYNHFLLDIKGI